MSETGGVRQVEDSKLFVLVIIFMINLEHIVMSSDECVGILASR